MRVCSGVRDAEAGMRYSMAVAHAAPLEEPGAILLVLLNVRGAGRGGGGGCMPGRPALVIPHADVLNGSRGHKDEGREGRRVSGRELQHTTESTLLCAMSMHRLEKRTCTLAVPM